MTRLLTLGEQRRVEAQAWADPDRWRYGQIAISSLARVIVRRVWGDDRPLGWLTLAGCLIAQRLDDDEPTPRTAADPLQGRLRHLIDQEWAAQQGRNRTPN